MAPLHLLRIRPWHGVAAVLAVVVLVLLLVVLDDDAPQPRPPGPPGTGPLTLVSMGDSTLSGEGTGDYTADTDGKDGNWCHRSPKAAIHQTEVPGIDKTVNLACSGAAAAHVALTEQTKYGEGSQARRLRALIEDHRVAAIVVAVGANDEPKFSHRIPECAKALYTSTPCSEQMARTWDDTVDAMVPKVVDALSDVRSVLADAGYRPSDYELVVQSYPSPVSPDIPEKVRSIAGCPFLRTDLEWLSTEGVGKLSDGIERAADEADARFLDLSRSGEGREACTGGDDPSSEWFTRLTVQWDDLQDVDRASHSIQESFHSNAAGHAQLGRCLTQFLTSSADSAACLPGADGDLNAASTSG